MLLGSTSNLESPLVCGYITDLSFRVSLGDIHMANFFKKDPSFLLHVSKFLVVK